MNMAVVKQDGTRSEKEDLSGLEEVACRETLNHSVFEDFVKSSRACGRGQLGSRSEKPNGLHVSGVPEIHYKPLVS
jgi:hypothetical protein